jgi:hypothetical protein
MQVLELQQKIHINNQNFMKIVQIFIKILIKNKM